MILSRQDLDLILIWREFDFMFSSYYIYLVFSLLITIKDFMRSSQDVFQEIPSKRLPGDVFKTSLRRVKTSSRPFLVNAKDHLATVYELSIYVSFKLLAYYHPITRQRNWINLNKLNTLKHGKLGFLWTVKLKNTFSKSLNTF